MLCIPGPCRSRRSSPRTAPSGPSAPRCAAARSTTPTCSAGRRAWGRRARRGCWPRPPTARAARRAGAAPRGPLRRLPPCRKIAGGNHPDVLVAGARSGTWPRPGAGSRRAGARRRKDIVVDQVRDLVDHRLSLKRFEGRRRFVLIDPADAMNPQAQNALLKTLEEPPRRAPPWCWSRASPDALLPTIRSRCLRVSFAPLPDELVVERLVAAGPEPCRGAAGGRAGRRLAGAGAALDAGRAGRAPRRGRGPRPALDPDDALARWIAFAPSRTGERPRSRGGGSSASCSPSGSATCCAAQAGGGSPALLDLAAETARAAATLTPAEVVRRREEVAWTTQALRQNASPVAGAGAAPHPLVHGVARMPAR